MKYHGSIGISTMLAQIKANPEDTFTIDFVRAADSKKKSDKKRGSIKRIAKAVYGSPKKLNPTKTPGTSADNAAFRKKNFSNFKGSGQFPITDTETMRFETPLFSHVIGFNGLKVIH